jgi:hypothetical protein
VKNWNPKFLSGGGGFDSQSLHASQFDQVHLLELLGDSAVIELDYQRGFLRFPQNFRGKLIFFFVLGYFFLARAQ